MLIWLKSHPDIFMRLTKLDIKHYKTMEDPVLVTCFSDLHILIGPNNAGKTNVLDAIELFFSPNLNPERFYDSHSNLSVTTALDDGSLLDIYYKNDERSYFLNGLGVSGTDGRVLSAQKKLTRARTDLSVRQLITRDLRSFADNYNERYKEFCATLEQYFEDVELSEKLFLDNVRMDRHDRPIGRLGDGFRRLFIMLFYIFHPSYDIVLIDEAELHLHPTVIKQFLKILLDAHYGKQIFLTTHSSVFVQPLTVPHVWRIARDEHQDTKIYGLPNCGAEYKRERLTQELNADNTEMFFADSVLLVEGVSDRILLRGLIDRFYTGKCDIKVIYTGGKGNIDIYASLCEAFHIPYFTLLDHDALQGVWSEHIRRALLGHHTASAEEKVRVLKECGIYLLEGTLEKSYPKKYQKKDTKPLNALYASQMISKDDLISPKMRVIREVIEKL